MGLYKNTNGVLSPIAGRGKAEYGASTVRTGTVTFPSISANYFALIDVVFDEPMPDSDYLISFINGSSGWAFYDAVNITQNGFRLCAVNTSDSALSNLTVTYTAFKLYTDKEYNDILAAMPSNASASNKLVTESSALKVKVKTESITTCG